MLGCNLGLGRAGVTPILLRVPLLHSLSLSHPNRFLITHWNSFPHRIYVEGTASTDPSALASPTSNVASADADDFFSSWDKPAATSKPVTPQVSKPSTPVPPPIIGTRTITPTPAVPRTTNSASIRAASASSSGTTTPTGTGSKLGATKPGGFGASKLGAKKGLGAAKVSSGVSFEEAARKAQEEEKRVKKEKEERERIEAEERKKAAEIISKSPPASATSFSPRIQDMTPRSVTEAQRKKEETQNAELERLGMGVRKINLAAAAPTPKSKKIATVEDTTMYAREKFGNQKGTILFLPPSFRD